MDRIKNNSSSIGDDFFSSWEVNKASLIVCS